MNRQVVCQAVDQRSPSVTHYSVIVWLLIVMLHHITVSANTFSRPQSMLAVTNHPLPCLTLNIVLANITFLALKQTSELLIGSPFR